MGQLGIYQIHIRYFPTSQHARSQFLCRFCTVRAVPPGVEKRERLGFRAFSKYGSSPLYNLRRGG
jgi:hypothetical protein